MDSQRVIARFEAERQALALLSHPNIAQVHEAGCTDSGRPYFVMEAAEGLPINAYCDRHELTIEARLGFSPDGADAAALTFAFPVGDFDEENWGNPHEDWSGYGRDIDSGY